MRQPVAGATQLLSPYAPASVIANEGPGTLYLYRNSAVSATVADSVIGTGGSVTWPGGEVWGFSDSTVINVLNVGAGIDSGTVAITGTVKTEAAGSSGGGPGTAAAAYHGLFQTVNASTNTGTVSTPANTVVNDLLLFGIYHKGTSTQPTVTGWTYLDGGTNATSGYSLWVYYKTATATDAQGGGSIAYTMTGSNSWTYLEVVAIGGATTPVVTGKNTVLTPSPIVVGYGNSQAGTLYVGMAGSAGASGAVIGFSNPTAAQSGPPDPQNQWTHIVQTSTQASNTVCVAYTYANWPTAASYLANITNATGVQGVGLLIRCN